MTITVNDTLRRTLQRIAARSNNSLEEAAAEMIERGAKDAEYRHDRNVKKWQQTKAINERIKELEEKVEIAERAAERFAMMNDIPEKGE
jgi:gamma-glutamyl:cysteine ligase YbdK (ATP-grasp superfamily)